MAIIQNKKMDKTISNLLSRQNYLVTQANDLARSFGNLTAFEHKVLDYCFSYVKAEDTSEQTYVAHMLDIIRHLGLNSSGKNYLRVAEAFRALNAKTAIYLQTYKNGKKGIIMTSLFDYIEIIEDGKIEFQFSKKVAPFIFELKQNFYSFKLSELANVRSKYALTLLKLWNANSIGKLKKATIKGDLEEWESWFLGSDKEGKPRKWSAGRFKQRVLNTSIEELGRLYPKTIFYLTTEKNGRRVTGYQLDITPIKTALTI
ncbi:MAG TPA: replication initiation protein [Limosilactobacillus reuteri]|nr:replication initiation protein [Limosilactobacillus reuteri]